MSGELPESKISSRPLGDGDAANIRTEVIDILNAFGQ